MNINTRMSTVAKIRRKVNKFSRRAHSSLLTPYTGVHRLSRGHQGRINLARSIMGCRALGLKLSDASDWVAIRKTRVYRERCYTCPQSDSKEKPMTTFGNPYAIYSQGRWYWKYGCHFGDSTMAACFESKTEAARQLDWIIAADPARKAWNLEIRNVAEQTE